MTLHTLWTIQPPEFYDQLKKDGRISIDEKWVHDEWSDLNMPFAPAYNWMIKKMETHIKSPKPENVKFPIWSWYSYKPDKKRPDLRDAGYTKRGNPRVLIELQLPFERFLISDFSDWHVHLNQGEEDFKKDYLRFDDEDGFPDFYYDSILFLDENKIPVNKHLQATFWELYLQEVISVKYFKAK